MKEITALETYLLSCLGFVFVAILEFAIVLWIPDIAKYYNKDSAKETKLNRWIITPATKCIWM